MSHINATYKAESKSDAVSARPSRRRAAVGKVLTSDPLCPLSACADRPPTSLLCRL